jgi:hypothetical protein
MKMKHPKRGEKEKKVNKRRDKAGIIKTSPNRSSGSNNR